jgi:signal transduction histidine kinase
MLEQAVVAEVTDVADVAAPRLRTGAIVNSLTISITACFATIAAVAPTVFGSPAGVRRTAVPLFVAGVVVLFGLGLSDLVRGRDSRFARGVVAAGAVWSLSALAVSSGSTPYSIGRVSNWLVTVALVYLLLSYPSGRLTERFDRLLFAAVVLVLLLYLPTALVAQHYPSPGAWSLCTSQCPRNAFALGRSTPMLVTDLVIPVRELLTVAVFLAVPVAVSERRRKAAPLLRGIYLPILVIAVLNAVTFGVFFAVRSAAPTASALSVVMWVNVLLLPAVGVACVAGWTYCRLLAANALERLARNLKASATPIEVSHAVADALEDPTLLILHSSGDQTGWVNESGAPAALEHLRAEQQVTEVVSGQWRIAIIHEPALSEARSLVQTAGSYALTALENDHLTDQLRYSLEALAESRAQGVVAENRERRKIERDLHDGAQQRLVALRVRLAVVAGTLENDDPGRAEVIRALGEEIDATIDEVRSFARGVYPTMLARGGLSQALRAAGRSSALPTTVHADRLGRYPPELETTVYFVCLEALQNAAKHARGATGVEIVLSADRHLHFEIRDDGAGFDVQATQAGTGLSNLRERLTAVGGTMTIYSAPGRGTRVTGSIPLQ